MTEILFSCQWPYRTVYRWQVFPPVGEVALYHLAKVSETFYDAVSI